MAEEFVHPDFGPAAQWSEYKVGDHITYRQSGEAIYSGTIIWVSAAGEIGTKHMPPNYVVERDGAGNSFPDIVFFSDVVVK